ncbi:hypothetical protein SKAU_G00216990 [Synaphobranchus kaupii]|uniref:Uncharacterized protein n=1 Tax=Synaphobranchus kaupii TaxID=118154 RepID=A0A9Q1FA83_SYNKA|nr:hypothetical protein SKAU_G00216990 [Synaphobranchus kaupii]
MLISCGGRNANDESCTPKGFCSAIWSPLSLPEQTLAKYPTPKYLASRTLCYYYMEVENKRAGVFGAGLGGPRRVRGAGGSGSCSARRASLPAFMRRRRTERRTGMTPAVILSLCAPTRDERGLSPGLRSPPRTTGQMGKTECIIYGAEQRGQRGCRRSQGGSDRRTAAAVPRRTVAK